MAVMKDVNAQYIGPLAANNSCNREGWTGTSRQLRMISSPRGVFGASLKSASSNKRKPRLLKPPALTFFQSAYPILAEVGGSSTPMLTNQKEKRMRGEREQQKTSEWVQVPRRMCRAKDILRANCQVSPTSRHIRSMAQPLCRIENKDTNHTMRYFD